MNNSTISPSSNCTTDIFDHNYIFQTYAVLLAVSVIEGGVAFLCAKQLDPNNVKRYQTNVAVFLAVILFWETAFTFLAIDNKTPKDNWEKLMLFFAGVASAVAIFEVGVADFTPCKPRTMLPRYNQTVDHPVVPQGQELQNQVPVNQVAGPSVSIV